MTERADEEAVISWWGRWPESNIGVVTGAVSGVAVIDIDPRHNGEATLAELESIWAPLPPTLESQTGGGGRHLWFATAGAPVASVDLGYGVELKAERGIIVCPPSAHASGEAYRWVDYSIEPVFIPEWVLSLPTGLTDRVTVAREPAPIRTAAERDEFRQVWAEAGIELAPGDAYYLCPFHDDHHPSLHIDAEGCRWYCFACRIGGGIGGLRRRLGIGSSRPPRDRMRGRVGRAEAVTIAGDGRVEVVGESFHQDELLALAGGQRRYGGVDLDAVAHLSPIEGDGIEVLIDDRSVGFLAGVDATRLSEVIGESLDLHGFASCRASIRGGWDRGRGDVGLFGVTLFMPTSVSAEA